MFVSNIKGTDMKVCVVRIRGGLGNQMFQYAFAYLVCKQLDDCKIIMDIREYKKYFWPFDLLDFCLFGNSVVSIEKQKYDFSIKKYHLWQYLYRKFKQKSPNFIKKSLLKKGYLFSGTYCEMPMNIPDKNEVYLYGYYQNAELLLPIRQELVKIFSFKKQNDNIDFYKKMINKKNSLSVCVRLAKQVELDIGEKYIYSSKCYYRKLIAEVERRRGVKPQLVVTSNDIERIIEEKWFSDYENVIYVKSCSATEQMEILRNCNDYILSNSTFSWWVAFLGSFGKNSLVFAPRIWYQGEDILKDTKLYFEGMEIIDE